MANIQRVVNTEVTFTGEASAIPTNYTWDFGDGSSQIVSTTPSVKHTYTKIGTFQVTQKVDNPCSTNQCTTSIDIVAVMAPGGIDWKPIATVLAFPAALIGAALI